MTKLFFTRENLWKYGNQLVWDPAKVSPGHKSRRYLCLTILRTRIPLKPWQKKFFLVDRSLFTFRWTDWKFRTLLVWSNLVASGPIPLLFPTEIIWELPLHTAAITSSRGSSPRHKTFNQQETDLRAVSVFTGLTTQLNAHAGTLTESTVCRWGNLDTFCHRVARLQTLVPSDNLVFS